MGLELSAEAGDAHQLIERQVADVDPCLGVDEDLHLAGAVVDRQLVAEGKVVRDGPGDTRFVTSI
jgi:hypothetical protein